MGASALYLAWRESPQKRIPDREERPEPAHSEAKKPRPKREISEPEERPAQEERSSEVAVVPGPAEGGRVALVIDDLGHTVEDLRPIEDLRIPLSYAVLPYEEQTPQVVEELRDRGAEILLHLPMEPSNGEKNPGPGALRLGMTPDELRQGTLDALEAVPGAVGVNNHMGSGLSADEPSMTTILRLLATRGLFFLDSRTSAQSVAYRVASRLGVPAAERQVFLDPDPSPEAIRGQFHRLLDLARTRGAAVAIGHPHPETLAVLAEEIPKAQALGYEFVPVSYLLDRPDAPEE